MDIARPDQTRRKRMRRVVYGGSAVLAVGAITLGVSHLKPAAPEIERGTVWIDTVKRGPMVRDVRGLGKLVVEDYLWIPADSDGRIEKINFLPGSLVHASDVLMVLNNPDMQLAANDL